MGFISETIWSWISLNLDFRELDTRELESSVIHDSQKVEISYVSIKL
jgi:hypothetical protein